MHAMDSFYTNTVYIILAAQKEPIVDSIIIDL